ncbi:MAG: DNA helicase-2/ATP-dependent DNA helicase PcrA [Candidatus Paceibacteria bacterium]|jgi:DNA helicase-2/ATP-dependent DNA helicase PcrA
MSEILTSDAYTAAYKMLNKAQKQAVDTIEGPVMVIAGPGTGKTQILTLRIANILLQTDVQPNNILALTFTESGAKAMRERLLRYIGAAAYRVEIATFHSFSQKLIAKYPDAYPTVIGGQPATDIDRISILEAILEDSAVSTLRPGGNPEYYVKPLMGTISDLKRENISPNILSEMIAGQEKALLEIEQFHEKGAHKGKERGEYKDAAKSIEKNQALLHVYRLYEASMRDQKLYDFDDMILQTVQALGENEDMLRDLQEQYQYLLADEHQDVNGAQNRIIELLADYHDQPNVFVVGDEKQAIFRFQGASLQNFLYFESHFKNTTVISLTENYRSGQEVLDAAHSLIEAEDVDLAKLRVPLNAAMVKRSSVTVRDFSHQAVEDSWLVTEVQSQITAGVPPEEVVVIVRSNREVEDISGNLRKAGIAAQASAESDILYHPVTQTVEQLLRAVSESNAGSLFTVLHGAYWGIEVADVTRICAAQNYKRTLTEILRSEEILTEIGVADTTKVNQMVAVLEEARARTSVESPHEVLAYLLEHSGYKDYVLKHDPYDGARIIRRLYDEIEELVRRDKKASLAAVLSVFAQRRSYGLPLSAPFIGSETHAVQVMTAHKSKGLEFQVVFAPHLVDSVWGGKTRRELFKIPRTTAVPADAADDEKRLLYVLMTRAKQTLYLSSSELNADGRPLTPSRLLAEIEEELIVVASTEKAESAFVPLDQVASKLDRSAVDYSLVASLFMERGFSATSLNNYLRDPWEFYFKNILRVPEVQPPHMLFGTAVHAVLQRATTQHTKSQSLPTDAQLIQWLELSLSRLPLTTVEYTRLHAKGLEILVPYVQQLNGALPVKTEEEFAIKVELSTGNDLIPTIPLKGNLDRLDFAADGQLQQVVDYKTGKPKSRNVIEGKTQSSDGAYKRQLTFYALLLDLYDDERYQSHTGVLSFVESAATGAVKEEVFVITSDEVADLKQEIIEAAISIVDGKWATTECDPSTCDYCHLVD